MIPWKGSAQRRFWGVPLELIPALDCCAYPQLHLEVFPWML